MILIIEFDVADIPKLLQHFVPGYIAISVFSAIVSKEHKSSNIIWMSCVASYILNAVTQLILPEKYVSQLAVSIIITCMLAVLSGILSATFVQSNRVRKLCLKFLHFSPASGVLAGSIDLSDPGTMARVYLKDADYYVEGFITGYSSKQDDPYISLCYYSYFRHNEKQPYYTCENEDKTIILNVNDMQHIETWPNKSS